MLVQRMGSGVWSRFCKTSRKSIGTYMLITLMVFRSAECPIRLRERLRIGNLCRPGSVVGRSVARYKNQLGTPVMRKQKKMKKKTCPID